MKAAAAGYILCAAVIYCIAYVLRRRTRYRASCGEGCVVIAMLFLAFILVPTFLGATLASRPR